MPTGPRIQVLGELQLVRDGAPCPLPSSRKTRALLGYLVLEGGEHLRASLCDLLWDGPADPRAALRWSLSKLRPLLDGDRIRVEADRERVRLLRDDLAVDLFELQDLLDGDLAGHPVEELEAAAAGVRGELLEGLGLPDAFPFEHWLGTWRERARGLHDRLLAHLVERLDHDPARALEHARARVALDPLDPERHGQQVRLLVALGRRDEAERVVRAARRFLERELGPGSGAELARLLRPSSADGTAAGDMPAADARDPAPPPPAPRPAPRDPRDVHALGLFGRADLCARLEAFLDADPAPVLWLSGEAGIGKSRLLEDLVERARARGLHARAAKAYEAEGARPLALGVDLLGGALPEDPGGDRTRLFEAVRARLREAGDGAGVLLVLDDLQWVDEASAALLSWLAREAAPDLRLAVAARRGELDDNPAAQRLRRALLRDGLLEEHAVPALDEAALRALVRAAAPDLDGDRAWELSGGHPLFALELARGGDGAASPRLRACLDERLVRLDPEALEVLRAGAVVGRPFSPELLAEVTGLRPGELLASLEGLEQQGFLRPAGEALDFAHDLVRQAVVEDLSIPGRRLLHGQVARALEADPRHADELSPDLARQASAAGQHALAARACVDAGRHGLRLCAPEEATRLARRGLEHAAHLEPAERRARSVALHGVEVHAGLGRRRPEELRASLADLAAEAHERGEAATARDAHYLLSVLEEEAGRFEDAERHTLAAAAEGRLADPATEVRALANTGRCLAQLGRDLERADRLLAEVADAPEGFDGIDLPWGRGLLAWHRGDLEAARDELARAAARAEDRGEAWAAFECRSRQALVEVARGHPERARALEPGLRAAAERLRGGSEPVLVDAVLALADHAEDPTAAGALDAALERLRSADSKALLATLQNQAATHARDRGQREEARTRAEEAREAASAVGREQQVARARALLDDLDRSDQISSRKDPR